MHLLPLTWQCKHFMLELFGEMACLGSQPPMLLALITWVFGKGLNFLHKSILYHRITCVSSWRLHCCMVPLWHEYTNAQKGFLVCIKYPNNTPGFAQGFLVVLLSNFIQDVFTTVTGLWPIHIYVYLEFRFSLLQIPLA